MKIRAMTSTTGNNAREVINAINSAKYDQVFLFAAKAGNTTLLVAVGRIDLQTIGREVLVVFDQNVSTADRCPRYIEICRILDAAEESDKVSFHSEVTSYTAAHDPDEAVDLLLENFDQVLFTKKSRPDFFALLSTMPEHQIRQLHGFDKDNKND